MGAGSTTLVFEWSPTRLCVVSWKELQLLPLFIIMPVNDRCSSLFFGKSDQLASTGSHPYFIHVKRGERACVCVQARCEWDGVNGQQNRTRLR